MKKYNVIILAGGEKGPLYDSTGFEIKALIPIHGKPMIDWVIEEYHKSEYVDNIIVVGDEALDKCTSMKYVRYRVFAGVNLLQNIIHAVTYVKTVIYQNRSNHNGYLFSFCDAAFLKKDMIDSAFENISESNADIVLHYVEKSTFIKEGLLAKRTYIPIDGKFYTGTTMYYLKRFSLVAAMLDRFGVMRKNRKNPKGILNALGCDGLSLTGIENKLSKILNARLKIFISPFAGMGMDVDKPADLKLANEMLAIKRSQNNQKKCLVLSDLHLLTLRTKGHKYFDKIINRASECELVILNGDIFDFKWSLAGSIEDSIDIAIKWLQDLCNKLSNKEVLYILGNHDRIEPFKERLDDLKKERKLFNWHSSFMLINKSLFIHGDIPIYSKGVNLSNESIDNVSVGNWPKAKFLSIPYEFMIRVGFIYLYRILKSKDKSVKHIYSAIKNSISEEICDVYSGHSHIPYEGYIYKKICFHNTGAAIKGFKFRMKIIDL